MGPYRSSTNIEKTISFWQAFKTKLGRVMAVPVAIIITTTGWVVALGAWVSYGINLENKERTHALDLVKAKEEAANKTLCKCWGGKYHEGMCFKGEELPVLKKP